MNNNKKNWIRLICLALAVCIPGILSVFFLAALPKAYTETFMGELADKYERLYSVEEKKIVIIGGSSVAFGIDSAKIEAETGYKVVNFGLYATLGTKIMLDLSKSAIKKGDIVILAPELDSQTLSMYFNATSAWQALEGNLSMFFKVGTDNWGDLFANLPEHLSERFSHAKSGPISQPGIYRHDSFNEYGDIKYERPYNVMPFQYDKAQPILLETESFEAEFVEYLNDYIKTCKKRGAEVYFSFCPLNESALENGTTEESIAEFTDFIKDNINCEMISDIHDSIMDKGYFYDTNYHLNDAGVTVHTEYLIRDILKALGTDDYTIGELPTPPGKAPAQNQ